jgi:hypothetical protein
MATIKNYDEVNDDITWELTPFKKNLGAHGQWSMLHDFRIQVAIFWTC